MSATDINAEAGGNVRWNHVKTVALVMAVLSLFFSELLILVGGGTFAQAVAAEIGGANLASWPSLAVLIFTVALAAPLSQAADYWGRKWILIIPNLGGIAGAIISARAMSMGVYIAGFCVGGFGFGSQGLILAVVSEVMPRKYRSWAQAAANGMNATGSIFSLAVGGYLVQSSPDGFRTYFYICAGIYTAAVILVALLYNPPPRELQATLTFKQKIRALDWVAYFLLGAGTVLLCLGLLWADNPYSWRDPHVLAPLLIGGVLLIILCVYAWRFKKHGLFNHALFEDRNFPIAIASSALEGMAYMAAAVFFPYSLSILQADKMDIYERALCQMVGFCGFGVSCFVTGLYIYKTKSVRVTGILTFVSFLIFMIVMATINATTRSANFWGYILFFGVGLGMALVTFFTTAQFATPPELIAVASGLTTGVRSLGGSVGLAIFNALFASGLTKNLVPNVITAIVALGLPEESAAPLITALSADDMSLLDGVPGITPDIIKAAGFAMKQAYVSGFRNVFICGAAFMVVGIAITIFLHNPSSEFNSKIDAPIEILSKTDSENNFSAATEKRIENNQSKE